MQQSMTFPAERDQVCLGVATESAAPYQMVNIEVLRTSTLLTAPPSRFKISRRSLAYAVGAI
jgi:hypothetical protein